MNKKLGRGAGDATTPKEQATSPNNQGWRSRLAVHPAAELFPLLSKDELRALADDISKNGLRDPAITHHDKDGKPELLDGRNRLDALELLGKPVDKNVLRGIKVTDPVAYVISKNIHRRHLTSTQKRELVAKLLKLAPQESDRQIAAKAKVHHGTVAKERRKQESRGEVSHVAKRTDTKGRMQPATKTIKLKVVRDAAQPVVVPLTEVESPEVSAEQRMAVNAELENTTKGDTDSAKALGEFKYACKTYLPRMTKVHVDEAIAYATGYIEQCIELIAASGCVDDSPHA